ncbi:hypothetical protein ACVMIL_009700 [Bradyrhizobium barranii subsp. barranii]
MKSPRVMLGHVPCEGAWASWRFRRCITSPPHCLVLSGLFYSASHHELGQFGANVCSYGSTFCDNPVVVFTGGALAAAWGMFVSVK